jgi:hypothetical protein
VSDKPKTKIVGFETIGMPHGRPAGFQRRKQPIMKLEEPLIVNAPKTRNG